jgi:hypothetical protein
MANRVISSFLSAGIIRKSEEVSTGFYAAQGKRTAKLKALSGTGSDTKPNNRTELVSLSRILYPLYLLVGGTIAGVFYFMYEISRRKANHVSAVS